MVAAEAMVAAEGMATTAAMAEATAAKATIAAMDAMETRTDMCNSESIEAHVSDSASRTSRRHQATAAAQASRVSVAAVASCVQTDANADADIAANAPVHEPRLHCSSHTRRAGNRGGATRGEGQCCAARTFVSATEGRRRKRSCHTRTPRANTRVR